MKPSIFTFSVERFFNPSKTFENGLWTKERSIRYTALSIKRDSLSFSGQTFAIYFCKVGAIG